MKKKIMYCVVSGAILLLTSSYSFATSIGHSDGFVMKNDFKGFSTEPDASKGFFKNWDKKDKYGKILHEKKSKVYEINWDKQEKYGKILPEKKSKDYEINWDKSNDYSDEKNACNTVPEPASMLLVGTGLMGLLGIGRMPKKKK